MAVNGCKWSTRALRVEWSKVGFTSVNGVNRANGPLDHLHKPFVVSCQWSNGPFTISELPMAVNGCKWSTKALGLNRKLWDLHM